MSEAAWKLHNDGKVRGLREVEKHMWVGQVQPEISLSYEVETVITPHKISAFTCECWQEGRRMMCVHVAAVLLQVRQFLEQKNLEKQLKEEVKDEPLAGRFTVTTVLSEVEPANLLEFVRDYARRDKDFSLALKTWFAAGEDDSEKHFLQLLDSVLPKNLTAKAFPDKDFRRLRHVLDELEKQLESAKSIGNFFAVFNLASSILLKINPLMEQIGETRRDFLLPVVENSWTQIQSFEPELLSPELRERQWKFAFEAAENGLFPKEMQRSLISWVAAQSKKYDEITDLFFRSPQPVPVFVLVLYLASLDRRGMEKAGIRVLDDFSKSPEAIHECLVQLFYLNCHNALTLLGEHFLEQNIFHAGHRRELEDLLLLTAEKTGDKKRMLKGYRHRFSRSGSFEMLRKMKEIAGKSWDKEFQNLIKELKSTGDSQKIAAVLSDSGDLDVLAEFLASEKNLPLLQKYESKFLGERHDWLKNQYFEMFEVYLSEHFGRPANAVLKDILQGLVVKNEVKMAVELIQKVVAAFPDRSSLAEDLAEIFPKHRRKAVMAGR